MNASAPVVFVHGLFQMLGDLGAAQFLAPRPILIPDLPGYASNRSMNRSEVSVEHAVEYLHQQIHSAGFDKAHIVGHSVGGAIAVLLASRYPNHVASVINVEGNFTLKDAFWSAGIANMDAREAEVLLDGYAVDPAGWLTQAGITPTAEALAAAQRGLSAQPAATVQAMARSVIQATSEPSYLEEVKGLLASGIPFHLVAGERSRAGWDVPDFVLRDATSLTIQPGVGHMMMLEDRLGFLEIVRRLV
jgi:pimeloyl-ACP methyl ester carboxylesterase